MKIYDSAAEARNEKRRRHNRRGSPTPLIVSDNWPEIVPVTEAEVDVFEAFFGDVLDELFGPPA